MSVIVENNEWVVCPYCGYKHGDAWEWANEPYEKECTCDDCEKKFLHYADYSVIYISKRIEK